MYVKNTLNPIERKSSATCTRDIIQGDINPKNAVHLKLVLIYRNRRITAADDDEFDTILEEIFLSQLECVIMGDFNLPNIDCVAHSHMINPCLSLSSSHLGTFSLDFVPTYSHSLVHTSFSFS